jgi:hypothetical protein
MTAAIRSKLQLSGVWFKSTAEIVLLYDLIVRSRPSNFKSTADIHYCIELHEIVTVGNHDPVHIHN